MTDAQLRHIFNPFQQVESTRYQGGTGLGLAISKRLAKVMGGSLDVSSKPDKGSTFTLSVPLLKASAEAEPQVSVLQRESLSYEADREITILVADDHPTNRDILARLVRAAGFKALEAEDGQEALDMTRRFSPDLVLMDIRMPNMSGLEAIEIMRQAPKLASIPVIAVSASVFSEARDAIREAGFVAFLSKPIKAGELFELIGKHLNISMKSKTPSPGANDLDQSINRLGSSFRKYLAERLAEALELGHVGHMNDIVSQLNQGDADEQALGAMIEKYARSFDFNSMEQLIIQLRDKMSD